MKKYKWPVTLFIVGLFITVFSMLSIGNFDGIFSSILKLFSIPLTAHLAWMQLGINLGMFVIHMSLLSSLVISLKSVINSPSRLDKWVFGFSLLLVSTLLLLWIIDGSYPVPYNTWGLLAN